MDEVVVSKPEKIFKFADISIKVLLMMAIKRRFRYIMRQTGFSREQITKESGINIAYIVYILRMETSKISDNVVRNLAAAFEIKSLGELFNPFEEAKKIKIEKIGPKLISTHKTVNNKSLWIWSHEYRIDVSPKYNKKLCLANLITTGKTMVSDVLAGEVKIDKPDTPEQRRFDFQQATKVVEEQKKVEKIRSEGKVPDRYEVLVKLLREEETNLLNRLVSIRKLIEIYKKQ